MTTAGPGSTHDVHASVRGRLGHRRGAVDDHVTQVHRDPLELDGAGVGAGQQQQVVDDGGHVADLVVDVDERRPDRLDRLRSMALEVLDAAPDDGQRRPQFVARVRGELALATKGRALAGQSDSRIGTSARRA